MINIHPEMRLLLLQKRHRGIFLLGYITDSEAACFRVEDIWNCLIHGVKFSLVYSLFHFFFNGLMN